MTGRVASGRARVVSAVLAVVALATGDVIIVAVCGVAREVFDTAAMAWAASAATVALGSYFTYGLPQIRLWERGLVGRSPATAANTARQRWASRMLSSGKISMFVAASLVGGALIIAWFYASRGSPRARTATATAAVILGAFWCAIYLNLLDAVVGA